MSHFDGPGSKMRAEFHKAKEDKERMATLNAALDEKFKLIRAGTFRSKTVDPTLKKNLCLINIDHWQCIKSYNHLPKSKNLFLSLIIISNSQCSIS